MEETKVSSCLFSKKEKKKFRPFKTDLWWILLSLVIILIRVLVIRKQGKYGGKNEWVFQFLLELKFTECTQTTQKIKLIHKFIHM